MTQLKDLPQIQVLLRLPHIAALSTRFSHSETADALRATIAELRSALLAGDTAPLPNFHELEFATEIESRIEAARTLSLRPVINATGVLIHTNLGRAPLAPSAIAAMRIAASEPTNLELDLDTGKRGSRHAHVEKQICDLTGAEAAVVVNNCAAAVLLSLMATAADRSVIASRGELIEIGGSFRLPDVIAQSGATLREVGATNKTRISDYANAIDSDTAVLLKSHTSNFKIVGFTAAPERSDLAQLAADHDIIAMEDLGSGVLIDLARFGLTEEPIVGDILKTGVDLVMFSGDKLLGGPQAGIIAGRRNIIASLKAHPLMRAVRIDKLSLAALTATLALYKPPFDPVAEIPVLRMLAAPLTEVETRAQTLATKLQEATAFNVTVHQSVAQVGAGSLPGQDLQSCAVALKHPTLSAQALTAALRQSTPPVIGRIEKEAVMLDMRTVRTGDLDVVATALNKIDPS